MVEILLKKWHNCIMEYKVNDKVVHCRDGLSLIVGETTIGGNDYFVVNSLKNNKENIYVLKSRTDNIIRPVMAFMKTVEPGFISNTKQRRDLYKKKLLSGNVYDLAYLTMQLHFFNEFNAKGQVVKLGPTDLQMLKDAESILFDEFATSYNVERDSVGEKIAGMLG